MHTYIIVLKIDDMKVGSVYNQELHTTLIFWFKTSASRAMVKNLCKTVVSKTSPITLKITGRADFGDGSLCLPVSLVEVTKQLKILHNDLLDKLQELPNFSLLRSEYSRAGWRPHVTDQGERLLNIGEQVETSAIYLVEKRDDLNGSPKDVFAELEFDHEA